MTGTSGASTSYVQNLLDEEYFTGTLENFDLGGVRLRPHLRTIHGGVAYSFGGLQAPPRSSDPCHPHVGGISLLLRWIGNAVPRCRLRQSGGRAEKRELMSRVDLRSMLHR